MVFNPLEKIPLIQVRNVTKRFGNNVVLDGINLAVYPGKIFGLIGLNGSGKTTLLNLLVGFLKPEKGDVLFKSENVLKNRKAVEHEVGFATQGNCFYPKLNVIENMHYFGALYGLSKKEADDRSETLLKLVNLLNAKKTLAEDLSSGMKRRLDVACSLIHDPSVLILDEPTEDLDPLLRREMLRLIKKINGYGTTIVITSHLLDEMEMVCDEIAILHNKTIIKKGTLDQLRTQKGEIHLATNPGNYERLIMKLGKEGFNVKEKNNKLVVYTNKPEDTLLNVLRIIKSVDEELVYVDVMKQPLAEIFEELTSQAYL